MKEQSEVQLNDYKLLFEMKLQYSQQVIECAPLSSKEGRIIGSGNGIVKGGFLFHL